MIKAEPEKFTIAFIGSVDSGKSTLAGHLLYKCGGISNTTMEKYEKQSLQLGKGSYKYAWVFDKIKDERERGITININIETLFTTKYHIAVIDTPGHVDFTKNMITGLANADAAFLVVSAAKNEFEFGFDKNGMTRQASVLAYTMGVTQLVVLVSKMDSETVKYSQERFDYIVKELTPWLRKVGYNIKTILFIPVSGWLGENLIEHSDNLKWYKGPTVLESINTFSPPPKTLDKPLRMGISKVFRIPGIGTVACGKVLGGVMKPGMLVTSALSGKSIDTKDIEYLHEEQKMALPGDLIGIKLLRTPSRDIKKGDVLGDTANNPPQRAASFIVQIIVLDFPTEIKVGYEPVVDCHTAYKNKM